MYLLTAHQKQIEIASPFLQHFENFKQRQQPAKPPSAFFLSSATFSRDQTSIAMTLIHQ